MRTCAEYQELISAMLDSELTVEEKAEVEAHIAVCGECKAMYEAFAAVNGMELAEVPDTLHEAVMTKVNAAQKAFRTQNKIVQLRPILTTAACLVVIVGTIFAMRTGFSRRAAEMAAPAAAPAAGAAMYDSAAAAEAPMEEMKDIPETAMFAVAAPAAVMEAPAEAPAPAEPAMAAAPTAEEAEEDYSYVNGAPAPEPEPIPAQEAQVADTATRNAAESVIVEIKEQMSYDAFIGFIVVDTETDTVWEMRLSEDTQMTDEVRKTLATGSVVTVEYHTVETDERPVIYADAVFPNDHVLTVKATEFWDNSGFTAEVVDAAAVPCKVGDTVKVVIDERTGPIPFNIIPDVEYRIAVDGYEQTAKDGVSIYAAAIWLT